MGGTTVGGAHAGPVLAGAGAIEGVNEGTFDVVTSPVDEFFPVDNGGRKLQRSWSSPPEVLVVESGGSSKVNVKDGGTASSGQVSVASAADLPDLDYEGSQSKSLAAAEVGKMGNPFVTNGAEAYGFAASGNECDRKAARDGPDADLCEQTLFLIRVLSPPTINLRLVWMPVVMGPPRMVRTARNTRVPRPATSTQEWLREFLSELLLSQTTQALSLLELAFRPPMMFVMVQSPQPSFSRILDSLIPSGGKLQASQLLSTRVLS